MTKCSECDDAEATREDPRYPAGGADLCVDCLRCVLEELISDAKYEMLSYKEDLDNLDRELNRAKKTRRKSKK